MHVAKGPGGQNRAAVFLLGRGRICSARILPSNLASCALMRKRFWGRVTLM